MKHSIRIKIMFTLLIIIFTTIFMYWFVNKKFLPSYYENSKVEKLATMYNDIHSVLESASNDEVTWDETVSKLDQLSQKKNEGIYVFELQRGAIAYSLSVLYNSDPIENHLFKSRIIKYFDTQECYKAFGNGSRSRILVEEENYNICKVYNQETDTYTLELIGQYNGKLLSSNESYIYIRSNFESIQESAEISNQFLGYVGVIITIISIIVTFVLTQSFTKPLLKLNKIAKEMSNMNFDVKYDEVRYDEIGALGNSINLLSDQLERKISELKVANNELQKDIQDKMQIDEMRKEFLSNVTHELKTPIAIIQGYAEGLAENVNDNPEDRNFYCEVIIDEASKMNNMVKKLLTLNQIESGNNLLTFEHFDLVELIRSILNSTNILFQQKEIQVKFEYEKSVYVWADEYMIEEVLTNYISNAVNHCKDPNIIEVKMIEHDNVVRVAVFNTGDPIPEEDIENIWDKFYKVDKARTREYGGNGIGLSIVKAIMNAHNQSYGVKNHEKGVEFWLELDTKN